MNKEDSMTIQYHYFKEQEALDKWCLEQLEKISLIAVDTEFMRVKTYFPKLCLIQLATKTEAVCVDPLKISNLDLLAKLLTAPHITKIFHAASQDLETITHALKILPSPVYDTQIAIQIVGDVKHPISYRDMVKSYCDVELEHDEARTRWDQRPLSRDQIRYAYNDVLHLIECYEKIDREIKSQNREKALKNAFLPLTEPERYAPNVEEAWKKVKGKNRVKGDALSLLKALAKMRELMAIQRDLPKRWLIKDDILIRLSQDYSEPNHHLEDDFAIKSYNDDIRARLIRTIRNFWENG